MILSGSATGGHNTKPLDYKSLLKAAEKALKEGGESVMSDFRGATATWDHKPSFIIRGPFAKESGGDFVLSVRVEPVTHIDLFTFVSRGTQPHFIFPRKGKYLTYRRDKKPKTEPGSLYAGPGDRGGDFVRKTAVWNPGIRPRNFTVISAINHQAWWNARVGRLALEWSVRVVAGKVTAL